MRRKQKEHQLTLDFTAAAEVDRESAGSKRGKSRRTVKGGDPEIADLSAQDTAQILVRIEEHLAAIRQQQQGRSRTWLTVQDVAEELQVSRDTIERLIAAGKLRAAPMTTSEGDGTRRMYRIKPEWLEEFLNSLAPKKPPAPSSVRRPRSKTGEVDFID